MLLSMARERTLTQAYRFGDILKQYAAEGAIMDDNYGLTEMVSFNEHKAYYETYSVSMITF